LCIGGDHAHAESSAKENNDGRYQKDIELLKDLMNQMKPWKKGPLQIFGTFIDTEWRSDW
jgi:tRNA (mo5U34)-methyltransferase